MKTSQSGSSHDKASRSLVKTVTYRTLMVVSIFTVFYFYTNRVDIAVVFSLTSNAIGTILYFIHERIWSRINWGRIK